MANGIRGSWILEADSRWIWRMSCDVVWCIFLVLPSCMGLQHENRKAEKAGNGH